MDADNNTLDTTNLTMWWIGCTVDHNPYPSLTMPHWRLKSVTALLQSWKVEQWGEWGRAGYHLTSLSPECLITHLNLIHTWSEFHHTTLWVPWLNFGKWGKAMVEWLHLPGLVSEWPLFSNVALWTFWKCSLYSVISGSHNLSLPNDISMLFTTHRADSGKVQRWSVISWVGLLP